MTMARDILELTLMTQLMISILNWTSEREAQLTICLWPLCGIFLIINIFGATLQFCLFMLYLCASWISSKFMLLYSVLSGFHQE